MIYLREFGIRETGLALSIVTAILVMLGYLAVQQFGGAWQPPPLEMMPRTPLTTAPAQGHATQPLVLQPAVPDDATAAGWDLPMQRPLEPVDTADRGREVR